MNRFKAPAAALLVALSCAALSGIWPTSEADAQFTYKKCGGFKFKGKHLLFTHRLPCAKAERKARYVLRHHHGPPHWKCELAQLSSGFAACHRGKRAWEFVPR